MLISFRSVHARALVSALAISCTTLVLAAGCGGGDSGGSSPSGGSGGDAGDNGEAGKASAGKGGKAGTAGAPSVEAGAAGLPEMPEAGAGGEGGSIIEPPAQNHSAVSFMTTGVVSKSKNFILISGLGESLGGTVGSKRSKSLKYTYIPGVIAASTP